MDMYKQNIITEVVGGEPVRRIRWDKNGNGFEDKVKYDENGNEIDRKRFVYYNDYRDEKTGKSAREVSLLAESILDKIRG